MRYRVAKYRNGFFVIWYDEKGKRHRRSLGEDKWEANAVARQVVEAASDNKGPHTVGQIVERYLDETDAIGKKTMRYHWKRAAVAFDRIGVGEVTEDFCRSYAAARKAKPGTILKELGLVRSGLSWGRKKGIAGPQLPSFWFPVAPPPRDRRLTRDELASLQGCCKQTHLLLFVLIARYTAARAGAILDLRWPQVDIERRRINLGGSGRQKRRALLPMHENLSLALAIAQKAALSPFVIEYAGKPIKSIKRAFRKAVSDAGLSRDVTPHVLRHTAASWMAEEGVGMDAIAQYLGHTSSSVTFKTYARFSPDYLQKASRALG